MRKERGREAAATPAAMAASGGFLRLRDRPSKRSMREQSKKQRRNRGDQDHDSTTEEESVGFYDQQSPPSKVGHEMIGVSVPRKARSACGKRSHENGGSGSYGGGGEEEQSLQQLSVKAASLSFSNVSSRKKMRPNGPKNSRPPKSPVDEEDIEIEIAEVLYGLKKQSNGSLKTSSTNLEEKDMNEFQGKRVEAESALLAVQNSSVAEAERGQPAKTEACSANSDGDRSDPFRNTGGSEGASGSVEFKKEVAKPIMEEERSFVPKVELSPVDSTETKAISTCLELERKRDNKNKFEFDLMAPPPMEKEEDLPDLVSNPNPENVKMKMEILVKNEEKVEKKLETSNEKPNEDSGSKLQPFNSLQSQPCRKRCATHRYVAHNIYLHQQVTKMNNFWPSATGSDPLCGTKPMMPAENIVIGNPVLGTFPGINNLQPPQEKEQAVLNLTGHSGKGRSSEAAHFAQVSQRKHLDIHQPPQPASGGNQMHGHTFMFPLGQHQASATSTSNQSGPLNYAKSTNDVSLSSNSAARPPGSSQALSTVAAVKEGPYLAINGYPFPISNHIGTPAFRGGNPNQAVPLFNGPFYSNQMVYPSPVHQQQHQVQMTYQNTSNSSDSSPSHKQRESQKLREAQFSSNNFLTSTSMQLQQSHKQYVASSSTSLASCKPEGEVNGEKNGASPAASHTQNNVYEQNFTVPFQPVNFTLMPYVTMGGGNHIEQSQQQGTKGGFELIPSKAYGMSFASFGGNNGTGSCLNFSSMAQSPAIFQSHPEMAQKGYKVAQAPQAAQQKNHPNHQISERKTGNGSKNPDDGLKHTSGKSSSTTGQRQTLVFDNSARSLNFMSSPVTGSWPPRSITMATTPTNAHVDCSTSSNSQQQHLFQFQLQKPHMMPPPQHASASKLPKNSPAFSQALIQSNSAAQSTQLKNSTVMSYPQQDGRGSHGQTQISFGGNPKSSYAPQRQQIHPNNQSSSSVVASSTISTLQSQQTENSSPGGNGQMPSPPCGRNLPSILSTCPSHISELKY